MANMNKLLDAHAERYAVLETSDNPYAKGIAWVDGELVPLHQARIPLMDQGFLHSDLTYDVPAVWDGRFFRLDDHLTRLETNCGKLRLRLPRSRDEVKQILIEMVIKSGIRDAFVEIIVTRGLQSFKRCTANEMFNNLYMFVQPYVWIMTPDILPIGGSAIVARTVRRISPGSIDPSIKNLQWGDLTRGIFEAQDRGAKYPLLTDGDTNLTEGPGFNIILIKDGTLFTPDRGVLHGITRTCVMEIAQAMSLKVRTEQVAVEQAYDCDEMLLSTTAGGIMPITTLDGQPVGNGQVGPITTMICAEYWAMHYDPALSFPVEYNDSAHKSAIGGLESQLPRAQL